MYFLGDTNSNKWNNTPKSSIKKQFESSKNYNDIASC